MASSVFPVIQKEIMIEAPAGVVFEVFFDDIDRWWPKSHRAFEKSRLIFEPKPSGRIYEKSESGEEKEFGQVIELERPHRVVYSWIPGSELGPTEVEIRFVEDGKHTRLEVYHRVGKSGLSEKDWPKRAERFHKAWNHLLPLFKDHVSQHQQQTR